MDDFVWRLAVTAIVMLFFIAFIGLRINQSVVGVLIDSRNKMSLSRLQLFLWTWLIVSSVFAIAWLTGTMNVDLDTELWALMGISTGSAAGSIIVKGTKEAKAHAASADSPTDNSGLHHTNASPSMASWSDMFKGEEKTDHNYVDIAKVQMFFFTVAVWLGYLGILLGEEFTKCLVCSGDPVEFPELSTSLVALIGISHAGYLTVKSAPKTPTT